MKKYRLKIAYNGAKYSGWQIQPNAMSIQEELEHALSTALRTPIKIFGSGRTDQGVHAKGQVAHFEIDEKIDEQKLKLALNGILPLDIRVKEIQEVDPHFHSRFSAKSKVYHYHFWTEDVIDPMEHPYRLHMRKPFDQKRVEEALPHFLGERNFTSFANLRQPRQVLKHPIRNLMRLEAVEQEGGFRLEFEGDGFLYKMVRNIVGVLIEIGQNRREISTIAALFEAKDRKAIGMPAPAHALFLQKVLY